MEYPNETLVQCIRSINDFGPMFGVFCDLIGGMGSTAQ